MNRVFLVAEADGKVGLGHLGEMRAIASALSERGVAATRVGIGPDSPAGSEVEWVADFDAAAARIAAANPRVIGWSVRTNRWRAVWRQLEKLKARHLWIADVADEHPAVDALIVPTLEPKWSESLVTTRIFSGPMYFPLDVRGPREVPAIESRSRDVLLTLGGADRTEASLRIAPTLAGTRSTVVIGPAFRHADELQRVAAASKIESVIAPDGLRDLLLQHRIVISAGGNTLFEAAAAGTPAVVTWEDPHEEAQGRAFEKKGCARVLGRGTDVDVNAITVAVKSLLSSNSELAAMSSAGRTLVDGRGADRIAAVLLDLAAGVAA